jgi:hypothetical protein
MVNGVSLMKMILTCLDTFRWEILLQRSSWIKTNDTNIFLSFRSSVGSRVVTGKHHAWCKFTSRARRSLTPRDFPYGAEKLIKEQTAVTAIILPEILRSNWLGDITHTEVLAITVQHHDDWEPLQKQNLL